MFTNFHIERFRGIPSLDIDGVKPITLLVGKNNTGKTSVLEAVFLLCGATDPFNAAKLASQRGQRIASSSTADAAWRSLFHQANAGKPIELSGTVSNGIQHSLSIEAIKARRYVALYDLLPPPANVPDELKTNEPPKIGGVKFRYRYTEKAETVTTEVMFGSRKRPFVVRPPEQDRAAVIPASFLSARSFVSLNRDAARYSTLVKSRGEQEVLEALQLVEPALRRLVVISETTEATVYADVGGHSLIPLAVCGEGMLRLFSIILAVTDTKGGVLLIDEIDNGLHYSVIDKLWPILQKLCAEHSVQLVATTHNDEMLRYALSTFRDDYSSFGLIRLDRTPSGLRAVSYNAEALEGVAEIGWEVRG